MRACESGYFDLDKIRIDVIQNMRNSHTEYKFKLCPSVPIETSACFLLRLLDTTYDEPAQVRPCSGSKVFGKSKSNCGSSI